ncbi:DUF3828 domain-containing protein [Tahibacter caeni]
MTWHETVVLRRENGRWLVDDIRCGGGSTLPERLSSFMRHPCVGN